MDNNIKVAICLPSSGIWKSRTAVSVAAMAHKTKIDTGIISHDCACISLSRTYLVSKALELGASHILFVDSDMVFPDDALDRLVAHGLDIVGSIYPYRRPPCEMVGKPLQVTDDGMYPDLTEMEFVGCGFLLIKRQVFENISKPWFFETYNYPGQKASGQFIQCLLDNFNDLPDTALRAIMNTPEVWNWLDTMDATGKSITHFNTEDVSFCEKARRNGFKIWADMTLLSQVEHIGEYNYKAGEIWPTIA